MNTNDTRMRVALQQLAADRRDEEAWRQLFQSAWPLMVALCARLLGGDTAAAQEAAQEALIRIARYAPFENLQDPAMFRAYARSVCRRVVHALYRKRGAEATVPIEEHEAVASDDLDPEQEASAKALFEAILAELEPDDQQLLRMTVAGYSLGEIAEELGIRYGTAAVRVHRIRRRVAKWLQDW